MGGAQKQLLVSRLERAAVVKAFRVKQRPQFSSRGERHANREGEAFRSLAHPHSFALDVDIDYEQRACNAATETPQETHHRRVDL